MLNSVLAITDAHSTQVWVSKKISEWDLSRPASHVADDSKPNWGLSIARATLIAKNFEAFDKEVCFFYKKQEYIPKRAVLSH